MFGNIAGAPVSKYRDAFNRLSKFLMDKYEGCLLAMIFSPSSAPSLDPSFLGTKLSLLLQDIKDECNRLFVQLLAFGGSITFPEYFDKTVRNMNINEVIYIIPTRAGASASLMVAATHDKMYLNPWTILDPFNISISIPPGAPKDISLFIAMSELIMNMMKSEGKDLTQQISYQALSLMAAHGTLYEYIEAQRLLNYLNDLIEYKIKDKLKISVEEFKEVFLGTESKPPSHISGTEAIEIFREAYIMDDNLLKLSSYLEKSAVEEMENTGTNGLIMTHKSEMRIGGSIQVAQVVPHF